jgi:hypothetical protein
MTERKTTGRLSIFRSIDAANVPAPWVPPEVPASPAAPGRALATRDRADQLPAPWVPAELPAVSDQPAAAKSDRAIAKLKPWVPPVETPRNLPAVVQEDEDELPAPQKRKKKPAHQAMETVETVSGNTGHTTIINNIVQQAASPVVYAPWWGWWGGCPRAFCPHRAGRTCWRLFCGW